MLIYKTKRKKKKEKLFLGQEKREILDSWIDFLWENEISELCIKNNVTIMFMLKDKPEEG